MPLATWRRPVGVGQDAEADVKPSKDVRSRSPRRGAGQTVVAPARASASAQASAQTSAQALDTPRGSDKNAQVIMEDKLGNG